MKLIKFLNSLKLPFLIGATSLLSGCSLTVPLLVFSGNGEDVYRGSATGYLDGSGTIKFSGTKFDVDCTGKFQYQRTGFKGWGTGDAECSDGTTANYKFDSATSSKGSGSGEDSKGRFFFFAYGYSESAARILFEKAAGYRLPKFGPKLVPPEIAIVRNPSLQDSSTTQEIISKVLPQTVMIQSGKQRGTGFLIDGKEIIITNSHVVGLNELVDITFSDNSTTTGSVIGRSGEIDIAMIKTYQSKLIDEPAAYCYGGTAQVGEDVVAIGNPMGLGTTITKGIVSGIRGNGIKKQIQTDTPVNPGNSGGPLINNKGEIIGVVTSKIGAIGIENIAFAIPTQQAFDSMGIKVQDLDEGGNITDCGNEIPKKESFSKIKNFAYGENFFKVLSIFLGLAILFLILKLRNKK